MCVLNWSWGYRMDTGSIVFMNLAFKLQIQRASGVVLKGGFLYWCVFFTCAPVFTCEMGGREGKEGAQRGCLCEREREILCARGM